MTGWQVQAMWEAESARLWEELNAPDPAEGKMIAAASSLAVVVKHLDKAADWIAQAASELQGTPMENVVASHLDELEDMICNIRGLQEKYSRGIRE